MIDVNRYPFTAIGRLFVTRPDGRTGACSATVVGNRRTLVAAAHCLTNGATYVFAQGEGLTDRQPVTLVADGGERNWTDIVPSTPDASWADWAVFDMTRPITGNPIALPTLSTITEILVGHRENQGTLVIGFPGDVERGERMVLANGCGFRPTGASYEQSTLVLTKCRSYYGLSGASILVPDDKGELTTVGVVSRGGIKAGRENVTILTLSVRMNDVITAKMARDAAPARPAAKPGPAKKKTR